MNTRAAIASLVVLFAASARAEPGMDASAEPPVPAAAAPAPAADVQGASLEALSNPESKASTGITDLRLQLLRDGARTVGFRGGLAARAKELVDALSLRALDMEQIAPFATLVTKDGNVPPVIVEARDVAAFAPDQIRTALAVYDIKVPERFVSVAPTWRDYLLVGLRPKSAELPELGARPQNEAERVVWKEAVAAGWAEGTRQADAILHANFKRLVRDYDGMLLYSSLLQQGMLTQTRVAETTQTVSGDTHQIAVGDTLRRFTAKATFQTDARRWKPTVAKPVGLLPSPAPVTRPGGAAAHAPNAAASGPSVKASEVAK